MDIDLNFPVSAPSDFEHLEQRSEVCQPNICSNILTQAVIITGKINEREVSNVLEDLEDPDPRRQLDDQTVANVDDDLHAPLIQTDVGAREPQLPVIVRSKVKRLCDPVRSLISR